MSLDPSFVYIGIVLATLGALFTKKVLGNTTWRATMTPLASIIGSGFLISAPILDRLAGYNAIWAMLGLCSIAFMLGEVIRWNISEVEERAQSGALGKIEKLGDLSLAFAYILSITYYLYLFSSFALKATNFHEPMVVKALTLAVLFSIAWYGHHQGLQSIENIEKVSVNVKLSIIIAFICALAWFGLGGPAQGETILKAQSISDFEWRKALGLLIMVQGFETSRYLGEKYDKKTRERSMKLAQLSATIIYLLFIGLFIPVFDAHPIQGEITETSVVGVSKYVFSLGPIFLLAAAVASQLSAAVADMGGGGGLFSEITKNKLKPNQAYILIAIASALIVVFFDIFAIISFASRAFAIYYFLQCLSSIVFNFKKNWWKVGFASLLGLVALAVVFLSRPFEG